MTPDDVYVKTDKGREEIKTRQNKLASPLRMLLIMIDGKTRAADILKQTAQLGITAEAMDQLLVQGLISLPKAASTAKAEPPVLSQSSNNADPKRFSDARQFMNETATNAAGLKSFMFTLKLEKAMTLRDLRELVPEYSSLIEKGSGGLEAEVMIKRAKELLV